MDYGRLAPEVVVLAGALAVLLGGSFLPRRRQRLLGPFAVGTLATSAAVAVLQAGPATTIFDGTWALGPVTTAIRLVAVLGCAAVLLLGAAERAGSPRESETVALMMLSTLGATVLAAADDLLVVVTGYLLASVPLYGLIGIGRSALAAEAAVKTYLQGALFGVLLLGGTAVLAGAGAGTDYAALASGLPDAAPALVAIGAVGVALALLFEAGAVPAHFWVPDAAQAASRQAAAFLTVVPKVAALVALLRFVQVVQPALDLALVVAIAAAVSMLLGVLAAFWQEDVRRLLGWSTVGQAGFLLLAVVGTDARALLVYAAGYAAANLAVFAVVAALPGRTTVEGWRGAGRAHPFLTGALLVGLLALVGTPPTSVFLGKVEVFRAAWAAGQGWLVVVAAVATVASLFYSLRWIASALRPAPRRVAPERAEPVAAATALVLTVVVLGFAALVPLLA
ncbi:NADH-quinone oxidoreductase subunit N [Amnibacterium endophyticum]|uniref:NADH-quinone oxidoreductase subunit N n=1 Tax=Amnibacterium endophyticum TaxID=2109337 RepID=A0ABW4LH66_9MICO